MIVMTDASDYGAGGAIFELTEEFEETAGLVTALKSDQLVGAFSRPFNDAEARWRVFEKEMLAIIQACEHYPLILDSGIRVAFYTDHENIGDYLTTMLANGRVSGRRTDGSQRWEADSPGGSKKCDM